METLVLMVVFFVLIHWLASRVLAAENGAKESSR